MILRKSRKITVEYVEDEKVEASFTFDFPFSEDKDYSYLATELKKKLIPDAESDEDIAKNKEEIALILAQSKDVEMRRALISCEGVKIETEEGKIIPCIVSTDNVVDEIHQKVAFEFVKNQNDMMEKLLLAKSGISLKNL